MSKFRNYSLIIMGLIAVLTIAGCTREITTVITEEAGPSSCFECHSDQDTSLLGIENQWANSRHASGLVSNRNSSSCAKCHTSEGFLQYVAGEQVTMADNPTVIHCFTCHAPHSDQNFNLRVTEPQTTLTGASMDIGAGNLCVVCHQARRQFDNYFVGYINSSHWGPHHGPQSDVLFQSNSYNFDGETYDNTIWHQSPNNVDGCVTCHVRTGGQNWTVGGHSFNMRALAQGENGDPGSEIITDESCVGCHGDSFPGGDYEEFDYNGVQTRVDGLMAELHVLLEAEGVLSADGHPVRGITKNPDGTADTLFVSDTVGGAMWNFMLVQEDRSRGIHNPAFVLDILETSIEKLSPVPAK